MLVCGTARCYKGELRVLKTDPAQFCETTRQGELQIGVAPITHSDPGSDDEAIEIPQAVRQHLGLGDNGQSWVIHCWQ